jgi:hypothetical protein
MPNAPSVQILRLLALWLVLYRIGCVIPLPARRRHMPRRKTILPTPPTPTIPGACAPAPFIVAADGVYRLGTLTTLLGLRRSSLAREIREKRLKVVKRCGVYFFLGADVLDWLRSGALKADSREGQSHA